MTVVHPTDQVLHRPWGHVTPDFWDRRTTGESHLTAEAIRSRLAGIATAMDGQRTAEAVELAARLDADTVQEFGEAHLHTVQVREVRGYLAALTGDHTTGLGWYLHCARLRATIQGPDHPDVEQATRRAYSLWRAMPGAVPGLQQLGRELLTVVTDIHGSTAPVARHTRDRLQGLTVPVLPSS
ncbi:hypothetical protein [Streptomyces sp. NPDC058045]|uniref:hypothetical protein n=1 Tax=Streptomyces sp. NPDC058045 TaxID=3346311 RepID=UPI0036E2D4E1